MKAAAFEGRGMEKEDQWKRKAKGATTNPKRSRKKLELRKLKSNRKKKKKKKKKGRQIIISSREVQGHIFESCKRKGGL